MPLLTLAKMLAAGGVMLLVLGGLFLAWQWWRPTRVPSADELRAAEKHAE